MESEMETSRDERAMQANQYRVTRDYCYMRIEMFLESPALIGISVEDLNEISKAFHTAQIHVLESMSKAARSAEFAHTISFDQKTRPPLKCESVRNKSGSELERIHRTFNENLAILARYELPNQDFMLFQMVWSKLDSVTREAFELQLGPNVDIPLFDDIMDFLDKRSRALENCYGYHTTSKQVTSKNKTSFVVPMQLSCEFCPNEGHTGEACPTFLKLSPAGRFKDVKEKRLCILCLQPSHSVKKCTVTVLCSECNQRHHTLLHFEEPAPTLSTSQEHEDAPSVALAAYSSSTDALFPTAVVLVKNGLNAFVKVRILLDSASACNFITLSCARRLGLKIHSKAQSVNGIGRVTTNTLGSVKCELGSQTQDSSGNLVVEAAVLQTICQNMPAGHIDVSSWKHLEGLELADPEFNTPEPVDMLVSVNVLSSVLKPGLMKGAPGQAIAIPTIFGWIVMGECTIGTDFSRLRNNNNIQKDCFLVSNLSLDNSLKESWEPDKVDSLKSTPSLSTTEPTVMSRKIEPSGALTKQLPVGQPFPLIETKDSMPSDCWHHVPTAGGNPVDHGSCGLLPVELTPCQSWWSGLRWIANPPQEWPQTSLTSENEAELEERKGLSCHITINRFLYQSFCFRFANILAYRYKISRNLRLSEGSTSALSTIRSTKALHSLVEQAFRKLYPLADVNGLLKSRCACGDLNYNRIHLLLVHLLLEEYRRRCLNPGLQSRHCPRVESDVRARNLLKDLISQASQNERLEFKFNPPGSPHFFGLSDTGVQSVTTYHTRVVVVQRLKYKELLYSRPLFPLSPDDNDLVALTPDNLLTREPLTLLPEAPNLENYVNPCRRWILIQKMNHDFWARWHLEYLHTLQQRHKWVDARENIVVGILVLISNEQCSPKKWKLGRVTQLHSGADIVCRVTLKTQSGTCKRPVVKLCVLPVPPDVESSPPSN